MLAGLIKDEVGRRSSGFPGLSRIPIIGGLFGQQRSGTGRSEDIILLTPVIIRNPQDARDLTVEYSRRFRAMDSITPKPPKTFTQRGTPRALTYPHVPRVSHG